MAEYNTQYLDIKKRIAILKAKFNYIDVKDTEILEKLDKLAKALDIRYSEGKYLELIEDEVADIEMKY